MKVGFLFLNTVAHVFHAAGVAFELGSDPQFDVHLFISTKPCWNLLKELSLKYPESRCKFVFVKATLPQRILEFFRKRPFPKISSVQKNHLKDFLSCQCLITTDKNIHYLLPRLNDIVTICQHHGPAHRDYVLSPDFATFNYNLLGGMAAYNYKLSSGKFNPEQLHVVGYPKFDIALKKPLRKFFDNDKPTVIYNPHDDFKISSWHTWGIGVLDYFYQNKEFNLIFAPHIQLFGKQKIQLPKKYSEARNIHIDVGSLLSCDMTYTRSADIYLGDMSSQYLEFLSQSRPCVFLNPNGISWKEDFQYRAWTLGDVIEKDAFQDLGKALTEAKKRHPLYIEKQKEIFNETFYFTDQPAGKVAAKVITKILTS